MFKTYDARSQAKKLEDLRKMRYGLYFIQQGLYFIEQQCDQILETAKQCDPICKRVISIELVIKNVKRLLKTVFDERVLPVDIKKGGGLYTFKPSERPDQRLEAFCECGAQCAYKGRIDEHVDEWKCTECPRLYHVIQNNADMFSDKKKI